MTKARKSETILQKKNKYKSIVKLSSFLERPSWKLVSLTSDGNERRIIFTSSIDCKRLLQGKLRIHSERLTECVRNLDA